MDNTSDCRLLGELDYTLSSSIYDVPILFISVLLCLAAVAVVCKQRLHKTLVYRLAMYQVLSAMEFSIIWIIAAVNQIYPLMSGNHRVSVTPAIVYRLTTDGVIVHQVDVHRLDINTSICSCRVFHKNLQRLELLYVVSSLLIPLAVTIVLLGINLTGCRGHSTYLREEIIFIVIFAVLVLSHW